MKKHTDLLGALDAKPDVSALVTDSHEGLETGDLTGGRHLLHGHDLHHLVLQLGPKEEVHDLVLCYGWYGSEEGEGVPLLINVSKYLRSDRL